MPRREFHDAYVFYITLEDGTHIVWEELSEVIAFRMHRTTEANVPKNIKGFGWGRKPSAVRRKEMEDR